MNIDLPGGATLEIPDGASPEAVQKAVVAYRSTPEFDKTVDKSSGAPARVRMIVGGAPMKDQLVNLRRFYPDAQPYGEDNFVFTDPTTGRPTLYNSPGLDFGDVPSVSREISQGVGGTFGAVLGSAAGPLGTAAGAGAGAVAGGSLFDTAMNLLEKRIDTRGVTGTLADAATDFTLNAAGQRAGELIGQGVKTAIGAGAPLARRLLADFRALGIEAPAGAVTGNKAVQGMEKTLENAPASAGRMQAIAERVVNQVQQAAQDLTSRFGTAQTPQGAGGVIKEAAKGAADRFATRQDSLYNAAFDLVGANTRVPVANVTRVRQALEAELAQAPNARQGALGTAITRLRGIENDAANGGVPFAALRAIRTDIGRDLDNPILAGSTGAQNAAMKLAYGALTQDLSAAAATSGSASERALAVADRYTRRQMGEVIPTLQKIVDLGDDEKAFKFAIDAAQDGGSKLARLRRSFTPAEWDTVAASVLGRMGRATAGAQDASQNVFSVSTFLTNYSKLAPEAKVALFGGRRYADLQPELDRLVRVASALKSTERAANPSGTARHLMAFATLGTLGGALGLFLGGDASTAAQGVGATIVAPAVAARLISSPRFVNWLAESARVPANGISAHVGRLVAIAKAEPAIKGAIQQYMSALRPAPQPQ